jgi:hypothetical protein
MQQMMTQPTCGPAAPLAARAAGAARPHAFAPRPAPPSARRAARVVVRAAGETCPKPSPPAQHATLRRAPPPPPQRAAAPPPPLTPSPSPFRCPLFPPDRPADGDDDDFEARLAGLKRAKGETPYGEGAKRNRAASSGNGASSGGGSGTSSSKPSGTAASRKMVRSQIYGAAAFGAGRPRSSF